MEELDREGIAPHLAHMRVRIALTPVRHLLRARLGSGHLRTRVADAGEEAAA